MLLSGRRLRGEFSDGYESLASKNLCFLREGNNKSISGKLYYFGEALNLTRGYGCVYGKMLATADISIKGSFLELGLKDLIGVVGM